MSTRSLSVIRLHLITRGEGGGGERRPPPPPPPPPLSGEETRDILDESIPSFLAMQAY